ncbi:MAG: DNA (cytosine-5-)-methyltransferase [Bacilli bacterium]
MRIKYLDLFCGIGGFHQGIERYCNEINIESQCIFAADNNISAANVYEDTYGIYAYYDMSSEDTHNAIDQAIEQTTFEEDDIFMVVGGFPCQAFSKAGKQEGFSDATKGTLFHEVLSIVRRHNPHMVLLENVRNILSHDNKKTWELIKLSLEESGYFVDVDIISPNSISDIPALRERTFIMCYSTEHYLPNNLRSIKEVHNRKRFYPTSIYNEDSQLRNDYFAEEEIDSDIEDIKVQILDMWDDFHHRIIESGGKMISPIWTKYFNDEEISKADPEWKIKLISKNKLFYKNNKKVINEWQKKYSKLWKEINDSNKKFEWNAGDSINSVWEGIIQFRPSGVRVKRPNYIPTLVAINQRPILGIEKRYLNYSEMAELYGFVGLVFERNQEEDCYRQLGNTVSVDVVKYVLGFMMENIEGENNG